jgi:hypothetical protein
LGGVGKTTLAHGFLRWDTGGLDGALWFDNLRDIRTAATKVVQEEPAAVLYALVLRRKVG